jgi:hypothetical protein
MPLPSTRSASCRIQRRRVDPDGLQALTLPNDGFLLVVEARPARLVHQSETMAGLGQALIGIVLPQAQAVFGPAGEHAIRLQHAPGGEVIHHHAEIGLIPARPPGLLFPGVTAGVEAGEQALGRRLLIARGAVDLPGEKQAAYGLAFQAGLESTRIVVIVFDGIARAQDAGVLQPRYRAHQAQLHIEGQAGGDAVGVELVGGQPSGSRNTLWAVLSAKRLILSSMLGQ